VSLASSHSSARAAPEPATQLCVVLACHHLVCALPIRAIDRLALPDAVERAPGRAGPLAPPEVVRFGEQVCAAWDLGVMLGLPPAQGAWVLLQALLDGAPIPLALRTGPCFSVRGVRPLAGLPPGIFRARRTALTSGFTVTALKGVRAAAQLGHVGLWLEPALLWDPLELEASAAALRKAR
jgi:hypothetical protein